MKIITKTSTRKVIATKFPADGEIRIDEGELYTPTGHAKRKWDSTVVFLSIDELRKILAYAESPVTI